MIAGEAVINLYSYYQASNGTNNIPSLYLLILIEIILGGLFIMNSVSKKSMRYFILSLIAISVANTFYVSMIGGSIYDHNPLNRSLQGYFMVIFCIIYYYDLLVHKELIKLEKNATFWVVTAMFFFFGTTQFHFLFLHFAYASYPKVAVIFSKLFYLIIIVYYSLLAIGLWKKQFSKIQ